MLETMLERYLLEHIRPDLKKHLATYEVSNLPAVRTDTKRKNLENKLQKLKELYLNDLLTLNEYKTDRKKIQLQLDQINSEESQPVKDLSFLYKFLNMDFESVYDSFTIPEKRELWRSVIREIRIDHDKNIEIVFL